MEQIYENWQGTKEKLLTGLSESKKNILSPILDNQYAVLKETASAGTTAAGAIGNFQKIVIPMMRRIIPGTIATELVGVQPMTGPVGLAYSIRFIFAESVTANQQPGTLTNPNDDIVAGDEVFGHVNPKLRRFYSSADASVNSGAFPSNVTTSSGEGSLTSDLEAFGGRAITTEVLKQTVTATSRKLQARFTMESKQDLNASHGLDIESELATHLAASVVQEIDNEIINDLIALAGSTDSFDMAGPMTGVPSYVGDRHAVLGVLINKVANEIARKTRMGPANWIVVSPLVASVLQSASKSVFAPAVQGSFEGPNNTRLVGILNGTIKVYTYIYHDQGTEPVLLGYKGGNGEMEAGYFYCPWIPITGTGVMQNPENTNYHMSIMTRYGKAKFTSTATSLGNSADYYGRIAVANLAFV